MSTGAPPHNPEMHVWRDYLQALFTREIPLCVHMAVRVEQVGTGEIELCAARAPNVNVHGTAFAGSLYSMCALAAWGLLHVALKTRGLAPDIVLADSRIVYAAPVVDALHARARFSAAGDVERFIHTMAATDRAQIEIPASASGADRAPAAHFTGIYAVAGAAR